MLWDVFCRVVDYFGDIGVCWRASADLASRGEQVRLFIDDPSALAWMAPGGHPGVRVLAWSEADTTDPGDAVLETFGCRLPPVFLARMARAAKPPVWVNLEYLSAEAYVERSHRLPSPQLSGPGAGLTAWFFYPGFTARTGGLLREPGAVERLTHVNTDDWLARRGLARQPGERVVSLFCYANPRLPELLDALAVQPTLLLCAAGPASELTRAALGPGLSRAGLRAVLLPLMPQPDYDCVLGASDLNFVRGEDSFVRAQWAGKPFVWHIYPQDDGAHAPKLAAFLDLFLAGTDPTLARDVRELWNAWNGLSGKPLVLPQALPWRARVEGWRDGLRVQPDLTTQLLGFVMERR